MQQNAFSSLSKRSQSPLVPPSPAEDPQPAPSSASPGRSDLQWQLKRLVHRNRLVLAWALVSPAAQPDQTSPKSKPQSYQQPSAHQQPPQPFSASFRPASDSKGPQTYPPTDLSSRSKPSAAGTVLRLDRNHSASIEAPRVLRPPVRRSRTPGEPEAGRPRLDCRRPLPPGPPCPPSWTVGVFHGRLSIRRARST